MTMAEAGHWQRVFELEKRHLGLYGGSRDRRPEWERGFEAEAIRIANGMPVKRADMIRAARDWDTDFRKEKAGLGLPATDKGIGDGIDRMAKRGSLVLK